MISLLDLVGIVTILVVWIGFKIITNGTRKVSVLKTITESGLDLASGMENFTDAELLAICNGCGAKDSWLAALIPQGFDGVDFIPACFNHDFRYNQGADFRDKVEADFLFLVELMILCNKSLEVGRRRLKERHDRAYLYFSMVDKHGHHAFVAGKGLSKSFADIIKDLPDQVSGDGDVY